MSSENRERESAYQKRSSLTRKETDESHEEEGKPTLGPRAGRPITSRQERMMEAVRALDEHRWQGVFRGIGADELALALAGADPALLELVTKAIPDERAAAAFQQYLAQGTDHVSKSVVDDAQGKLLRLASF